MLSVVMLNVVMLNVIMLIVVILSVVAPPLSLTFSKKKTVDCKYRFMAHSLLQSFAKIVTQNPRHFCYPYFPWPPWLIHKQNRNDPTCVAQGGQGKYKPVSQHRDTYPMCVAFIWGFAKKNLCLCKYRGNFDGYVLIITI